MRALSTAVVLLSWLVDGGAITWNFDEEGNSEGWAARAGFLSQASGLPILRSRVHDGVWRVQPLRFEEGRNPAVELISPLIGRNSALFDQMRIRFRVVHNRPIESNFVLTWTNAFNRLSPGMDPDVECKQHSPCLSRFVLYRNLVYTTDWQEVVISDLDKGRVFDSIAASSRFNLEAKEIIWKGDLGDVRIGMNLAEDDPSTQFIQSPSDVPEVVEIDWIVLTGVEEQIQGELPPPPAAVNEPFGSLFASPVFSSLGIREIGRVYDAITPAGSLGDLDGDGDPDLLTLWTMGGDTGFLLASNEGGGRFEPTTVQAVSRLHLAGGADIDSNGLMDLVLSVDNEPQIWFSDREEGTIVRPLDDDLMPSRLVDLDADGDIDIWAFERGGFSRSRFLYNDGKGIFSTQFMLEPPLEGFDAFRIVYPVQAGKLASLLWTPPREDLSSGYIVTYVNAAGDVFRESLKLSISPRLIRAVGDFDLDGDTDLITADERLEHLTGELFPALGLNVLRNRGDGSMDTVLTLKEVRFNDSVLIADVNSDGWVDAMVPHNDVRNPAIIVLLGQGDGTFVQEGRYPLSEGRGGPLISGDVDGDGDVDVLAMDPTHFAGGGVQVLLNQTADRITAVEEQREVVSQRHRLGQAYPNPFNPNVVIPFILGPAPGAVALEIYNSLGQVVRHLELGALSPGAQQVRWDGRDGAGRQVSSGVYFYRVQVGRWSAVGRMVKVE